MFPSITDDQIVAGLCLSFHLLSQHRLFSLTLVDFAAVNATLQRYRKGEIVLASFSHISSLPSAILPVKRLAALCHEHGVLVLIDGAHAPGQMAVDVKDVGADFYVGDGHKWMFTPKGVAFLWASEAVQDLLYGPVVDGQGTFADWFSWQGLDDYSKCECATVGLGCDCCRL